MTLHKFRPQFVYYQKVNNHEQHKQLVLSSIQQEIQQRKFAKSQHVNIPFSDRTIITDPTMDTPNNPSSGKTKINYTDQFINDVITVPMMNMINEIKQEFNIQSPTLKDNYLKEIWWNYFLPGKFTAPHVHLDVDFSGVYIVSLDEPNPTCFMQDLRSAGRLPLYEEYMSTEHITEGYVMIFPSNLLHWVNPCKSERCTIVFNTLTDWSMDDWSEDVLANYEGQARAATTILESTSATSQPLV